MRVFFIITAFFGLLFCASANAHEINPGYLEITQKNITQSAEDAPSLFYYDMIWKSPIRLGVPLAVMPTFPPDCASTANAKRARNGRAVITTFTLVCEHSLQGETIALTGLDSTLTDVLTRFAPLMGKQQTVRSTPNNPVAVFAINPSRWDVAKTYFILGAEHIWFGFDHLLFVLGLVLLIQGKRRIFETITAFTVAHSLTLIATTLGWVSLSIKPVEAVIALSIVFLASEIANKKPGGTRFTERRPWIVAAAFGLLHGFGFASALSNIGMPFQDVPTALLTFNLGVEFGQLVFVACLLLVLVLIDKLRARRVSELAMSYFIGSLSVFWLIQRLL